MRVILKTTHNYQFKSEGNIFRIDENSAMRNERIGSQTMVRKTLPKNLKEIKKHLHLNTFD